MGLKDPKYLKHGLFCVTFVLALTVWAGHGHLGRVLLSEIHTSSVTYVTLCQPLVVQTLQSP